MKNDTNLEFELYKNKRIAEKGNVGIHITMAIITVFALFSTSLAFLIMALLVWILFALAIMFEKSSANKKIESLMAKQKPDKETLNEESMVMNEKPVYYNG